jgi:FG-GAP-like repeat/IPT/TIG domain
MPNLYPGILPLYRSGQRLLCLCFVLLLPHLIFAQPAISSFAPLTGPVGTTVTISGSNFNSTPSANIVRFGTVTAQVTSATATSLTVTAPVSASYQPLSVTTGGLTAYASNCFSTTFNDPGQFTTTAFSPATPFPTGQDPQSIVAMDFDGDGLADLAVANGNDITVGMYLNASTSGSPSFIQQETLLPPASFYPVSLAAGDLDGDGKPDLVVANANTNAFQVFQNTSTLGHLVMTALPPITEPNSASWVAIGDLNGDGKPDLVFAEEYNNSLSVFLNTSSVGAISFSAAIPILLPNGYGPWAVAIADFDGDGKPDVVFSNNEGNSISVLRNTGTPGGAFSLATHVDFPAGGGPEGLAVGDLDGDGRPDIALANNTDNTLSLFRNTSGSGTISFAATTQATGFGPAAVAIADLDGDGKPDVAGADAGTTLVSVHRNTSTIGSISLVTNVDYPVGASPLSLALADLDGNGTPDIANLNNGGHNITVLLNQSPSAPAITSFSPAAGDSGTLVTISGTNFTGATAVSFGGVAASSFHVVSNTTITAVVSTGATGAVNVVTPNGTASRQGFTFGVSNLPPTITGFSPASGTYGTTVTIQGTGLTQVSSVSFGAVSALSFTILSDTVLTAIVGTGATGDITVTAPLGDASDSVFTYIQPPVLTISGFSPQSGPTGTVVTISGAGFLSTPSVYFGGVAASNIRVVSTSLLTATVAGGATGEVTVSAFNGADSLAGFTYLVAAPPPIIVTSSFSPSAAGTGTQVTIDGLHFSSATSVTFGGVSASFQIVSDSVIVATVGSGGSGEVTVANANSADSMPNFVYLYDSTKTGPAGAYQLVSFNASLDGNTPFLQWNTVYDAGISYYAVERGVDGNNFNTIATVKSSAAGGLGASYSYIDSLPKAGVNYYRIKAQDTTAAYSYSNVVAIQLLSTTMPLYPNPVKYGFFLVDLPSITKPSVFRLVNNWGMVVQTLSVPAGVAQQRIDIPGLLPGTYRLSWTDGATVVYQTVLVLHK